MSFYNPLMKTPDWGAGTSGVLDKFTQMMLLRQMLGMGKKDKDEVPTTATPMNRFSAQEGEDIMAQAPNPQTGANMPESQPYDMQRLMQMLMMLLQRGGGGTGRAF